MIRVVIADDHLMFRAGLSALLNSQPDIVVVGEASDGQSAVELTRQHLPDVVVIDLRMPGLDGIAATKVITSDEISSKPDHLTRVLVLSTFHDNEAVYGALRAGASGYVVKSAAPHNLVDAIYSVAGGNGWIDPEVATAVIEVLARLLRTTNSPKKLIQCLTRREEDVLKLMARGMTNAEIKDELFLSEATVKTHVSRIVAKTGSRDRTQAVVLAFQSGLVIP